LYCGALNRRRPSRPQHRTIEVPMAKFSKRPRIITGLSGITWARNNGGQICQTCYEPNTAKSAYDLHLYDLRNLNTDFFFEIVIDGKGSWENIKDGNYVFRWTVYHSESISELSFCWVAVVDEKCFKQEAEEEGYGPETPPKKGKTRRAITPKHKQEKVCKKRRVVDGEHLGCAKCLLYDPDDELKNDEFREEGARDEDDTDDGAMDVD
jgi:hypothetical protein